MVVEVDQLFTPDPSGVSPDPSVPVPEGSWFANLLATADILGLDTTAWQPGSPERTILAIDAVALFQEDVAISLQAQGRFLDFAASGTVTYTTLDGTTITQKVTPDPSIPSENPDGSLGWLDALAQSTYGVSRLLATAATGPLAIANTSASTPSYAAGQYHVANTFTGKLYSNRDALSIPPSAIAGTGGVITAVATGTSPTLTTNAAHGLAVGDVVYVIGTVGVTGLNGKFAAITSVPAANQFIISLTTSGTWTSGGTVYKCTLATMNADAIGLSSNASPGQVTSPVTQVVGVSIYNLVSWSAANYESNARLANRCRLKLGALSPNGPSQAYEYFALTAQQLLAAQTPAVTLRNGPIAKATVFVNPVTQVVTTLIASETPASSILGDSVTPGCANLDVTGATNASPIVLSTAANHGLQTGDPCIVSGVLGNSAANGAFTITVTGAAAFELDGTTGSGAYTGGGQVDGGDLGEVDNLIQTNVVPDGITAITQSALAFPVTVVATVVVPQAYLATYQAAAPLALQALFETFDIGGDPDIGNVVALSAVEGALFDAGILVLGGVSYVRTVTSLTLNGVAADLAYPSPNHLALLGVPTINVLGV